MNTQYVKPSIVKVGNPLYAKHGSAKQSYNQIRKDIDGIKISDLVSQYGSPLFVFSEEILRNKYRKAYAAVQSHYPNVTFGWSYKTNYLNGICKVFHEEGAIAEVVSHFEYEKARALGVPGNQIIFNGPYKSMASLKLAISEGAQIHADNFYEIEDIEQIAKELNQTVKLGIRINLNCGIYPVWSRFGFNLEIGQAKAAIERIKKSPFLKLSGIHTHIGTFILDPNAYTEAVKKVSIFIKEIEEIIQYKIEFLDLGGGFASLSHLKGIYQPPEIVVPDVEAYAEAIGKELKWLNARQNPPKLYLELGRHLVDEAGYLITQVVCDKLLPDGRRSYVLDAGVNLLYTSSWYKYKIEIDQEVKGVMEASILNGPLCMNIDIVDEAILLPRLSRYQNMILSPVGAYNVTQWMQFIQYRPAVVMIKEDKSIKLLRRAENLDDLNRFENNE
jgi:diaminopimelate decarboxylase